MKQKQIDKIEKHLRANSKGVGITPQKLARLARVPKEAVYKVVYDLRHDRGYTIFRNFRNEKNGRTMYYRLSV